jgi:hypothetical protein
MATKTVYLEREAREDVYLILLCIICVGINDALAICPPLRTISREVAGKIIEDIRNAPIEPEFEQKGIGNE